jgi:hypothetical protein
MEIPLCKLCNTRHWTRICPGITPSHGSPRVETKPLAPTHAPSKRRAPLIPAKPITHITPIRYTITKETVTKTTPTPPEKPPLSVTPAAPPKKKIGRPPNPNKPSNAEKQRAYRARKKAHHRP